MTALLTACLFFEILVHVLQKHARKLCSATLIHMYMYMYIISGVNLQPCHVVIQVQDICFQAQTFRSGLFVFKFSIFFLKRL